MGFWRTSEEREARDDRMEALHLARHEATLVRRAAGLEWFPRTTTFIAIGPNEPLFKTLDQLQTFCHLSDAPVVHTAMTKKGFVYPGDDDSEPDFEPKEIKYVQLDKAAKQWIEFCIEFVMGEAIWHEKWEDAEVKRPGKRHLTPFPIVLWDGGPISTAEQLRELAGLETVPEVKKHAAFGLVEGHGSDRMSSARYCLIGFEGLRKLAGRLEMRTVGSWVPESSDVHTQARVAVRVLGPEEQNGDPLAEYFDFATISDPLHE